MRIFLVRHGQTAWNVAGRAQGHTDIPLDETGLAQAACLFDRFDGVAVDQILCSDLGRCRQTAEPILRATGAKIHYREDLRERSFGKWEGKSFTEVAAQLIEKSLEHDTPRLEVRPPSGESFLDVWKRVAPLAKQLFETVQTTVVVSHGGTTAVLLAHLMQANLETTRSFRFANTSVTELEMRPDGDAFMLLRYADTSHLEGHCGATAPSHAASR